MWQKTEHPLWVQVAMKCGGLSLGSSPTRGPLLSLPPLCFTADQIKAKIVTKIKACISVLKCTEEASLLKEEGCGDEEQQLIRPRLKPQVESISNAAVCGPQLARPPKCIKQSNIKQAALVPSYQREGRHLYSWQQRPQAEANLLTF